MLMREMTVPTRASSAFVCRWRVSSAASGAANRPPITSPATVGHGLSPTSIAKTPALTKVRKNSARLTEPMVVRGSEPVPTSVVVTTGPQPPPPTASTKPPTSPSLATWRGSSWRRLMVRKILLMTYSPISSR